jgi:hypothetical protein
MSAWRISCLCGITIVCLTVSTPSARQSTSQRPIDIPPTATLEGVPAVRIESASNETTRHVLDASEAAKERLTVKVVDGQFYWTSRDNRLLRLNASGDFTYLSSSEPGRYIRLRRLNDKIDYIEHVDQASGTVTWWGELTIVVGK